MIGNTHNGLPRPRWATIIQLRVKYATFMTLSLLAHGALAQQAPAAPGPKNDDLDVTMQIIVDPDAKLPDEIVRRIPLPERKSPPPANANAESQATGNDRQGQQDKQDKQDKAAAREARDLGREAGQSAKDKAKEQREQARRAAAEERRRRNNDNHGPPDRPDPPGHRPPPH
jgi:hypothetical protein